MKYIALVLLLALLLVAGCAKKGIEAAPGDTAAQTPAETASEPTELTGDIVALEDEAPLEMDIDTAELEELDM